MNRDAAAGAVGDDERAHVIGNAGDAGLLAGGGGEDFAVVFEVEDADGVGARVGDVAALAVGSDVDEVRLAVDADGPCDLVLGGVDDRDGVAAGVDGVNFIGDRVCGDSRGVRADLQDAVLAKVDEVEDRDGVGRTAGNIGEFAVIGWILGEVVAATGGQAEGQDGKQTSGCAGFVAADGGGKHLYGV